MVVDSKGYIFLIEYLTKNLKVFETSSQSKLPETIGFIVVDLISTKIMAICEQNPDLTSDVRFQILRDSDQILEDLQEILGVLWEKNATVEQITFLETYIGLVKNMFDDAVIYEEAQG